MPRNPSTLLALAFLTALPIATPSAQLVAPNANAVGVANTPVRASGITRIRQASGPGIWMSAVPSPLYSRLIGATEVPNRDPSDHRGRNVLIGMGLGAAVGGILASTSCNDDCTFSVGMLVAPIGGAAIGALVALLLTPVR